MRIIAGEFRSRKIDTVETNSTRPTTDKNRESIFNMLGHHINIETKVLDLYAGSGSLGLEALSRGAKYAFFSDINSDAINVINNNINKLNLENRAVVHKGAHTKILKNLEKYNERFDLIFLDPPYKLDVINKNLDFISKNNLISEDGLIVCETSKEYIIDCKDYEVLKEKYYGVTKITILRISNS